MTNTFTTLPFPCLLSAASAHRPISTGKERDSESGNDYFGARYYASSNGPVLVALFASWIPAHRAAGVEPMQALRHE
jgi:hypothetical protein